MTAHKSPIDVTLSSRRCTAYFVISQPPAKSSLNHEIFWHFSIKTNITGSMIGDCFHFPQSYWEFEPRKSHQIQRGSDWLMGTSFNCSHLLSKRICMSRWLVQNNYNRFVFLINWREGNVTVSLKIIITLWNKSHSLLSI